MLRAVTLPPSAVIIAGTDLANVPPLSASIRPKWHRLWTELSNEVVYCRAGSDYAKDVFIRANPEGCRPGWGKTSGRRRRPLD
jgi:hypothetical protein